MKAVVQRVSASELRVDDEVRAATGAGLVVLVGIEQDDTDGDRRGMARKIVHLRIFEDDDGRMNRSVLDIGGTIMLVPNFTLAGDCRKGRRPSFDRAMPPDRAAAEFERLAADVRAEGATVAEGVFQAHMMVSLTNDGPVTLLLDSRPGRT